MRPIKLGSVAVRLDRIVKGKKDMKCSSLFSFAIRSFKWALTPMYKNIWHMCKICLAVEEVKEEHSISLEYSNS